jgi:hypothetical protein
MAGATELPDLVREFAEMSKEYLLQETVEPAKQLGRYAGFSIAAGLSFALAALLLGVASLRGIFALLPEGPNWEALGYALTAVGLIAVAGVIVGLTSRSTTTER